MTTLKEALQLLGSSAGKETGKDIADELLGKYQGAIPRGKSSTAFIKKQRNSFSGKIK